MCSTGPDRQRLGRRTGGRPPARAKLSPQDRRFVTQLVFGVIRRKATLDALLKPFVSRPFHTIEPAVVDVLRLGAFQLALLTHVPKHAAVFETVNLARHVGSRMARGFVNGVLRRVAETVTDEFVEGGSERTRSHSTPQAHPWPRVGNATASSPATCSPTPTPTRPATSPPPSPGRAGSPTGGSPGYGRDECFRLGFWFNAPPPLWLRVNKLKLDRESYRLHLAAKGIDAEPGEHPQSLRLLDGATGPRAAGLRRGRVHRAGPLVDGGGVGGRPAAGVARPRPVRRPRRQDDAPGRADARTAAASSPATSTRSGWTR